MKHSKLEKLLKYKNWARTGMIIAKDLMASKKKLPIVNYVGSKNFGDKLGEMILEELSNKETRRVNGKSNMHILGLGSIFSAANRYSIVIGSGLLLGNEILAKEIYKIKFVRGILTKERINIQYNDKYIDVITGDMAMMLSNTKFRESFEKRFNICNKIENNCLNKVLILHHATKQSITDENQKILRKNGWEIINTADNINKIYSTIKSSSLVVSNALHPLVVSDALGIPRIRIEFTVGNGLLGGDFKFDDYASNLNQSDKKIYIQDICDVIELPKIYHDLVYDYKDKDIGVKLIKLAKSGISELMRLDD